MPGSEPPPPPPPPPPPSSSLRPHALASSATASSAITQPTNRTCLCIVRPPRSWLRGCDLAYQPHHSTWEEVHEKDQHAAVDHAGQRLVDVGGVDRHELDEQRAEQRARDRGEAADDDRRQERERQRQRERLGREEPDRQREERPADPGVRGADREGPRLVPGQ